MGVNSLARQVREELEEAWNKLSGQLLRFYARLRRVNYTLIILHILRLVLGLAEALAEFIELLDVVGVLLRLTHFVFFNFLSFLV
uniref:Uncharacterized protein MANES_17G052000 n=1 Tax=Rhizophora mucronata TaxID=61149 RepID=A0A2P2LAI8_RHIMU